MSTALETKETKNILVKIYDIPSASKVTDLAPEGDGYQITDIVSFDYYESIYDPFVVARLKVFDSSGILEKNLGGGCGVRIFCPVEVLFVDPAAGTEYKRERESLDFVGYNCFFVKKVTNQLVQGKKQIYDLELTTRDAIAAVSTTIKEAWPPDASTGTVDYNQIIFEIMARYIKTMKDKTAITAEKTMPVEKILGNNMRPYELITRACRESIPMQKSGSGSTSSGKEETKPAGYAFFEAYNSYKFSSLISLVTVNETDQISESHQYKVSIVNDSETTAKEAAYRILSYKFNDSNTTSDVFQEIMSRKRGKPSITIFDTSLNIFKKIESLPPSTIVDKCEKAAVDGDFLPVSYQEINQYSLEYYNNCDVNLDNQPINSALTTLNYSAILESLKSKTSTIRVPGNLSISAGDKIYIEVPVIQGDGTSETEISDKYSGIFLVVKLSHRIEGFKFNYTDLEICQLKRT
jgi:hypothetical protein